MRFSRGADKLNLATLTVAVALTQLIGPVVAAPNPKDKPLKDDGVTCRKAKVAILGAGITGIITARTLADAGIDDFIIVEYKDEIGGRVHHENFGKDKNGKPLLVEYGANWVQGLGSDDGPENPIWTLEKKWKIKNTPSDFEAIATYNETGEVDFISEIEAFEKAVEDVAADAGELLNDNIQDRTMRQGLALAGWNPELRDYPQAADAVEWWLYDGEQAYTPEETSLVFNAAVSNFTFVQFSGENNFVVDQRGHNTWIEGEASEFLKKDDPRLLLSTIVEEIAYSEDGVIVKNKDGSCVQADYAVVTFSLGVLQQDVVKFEPELPEWKKVAIEAFLMGTYTKMFFQFNETWWPKETEFFLYADPIQRGWYPIWQNLDKEGFFPDSHAIFVTVTGRESQRVERMKDEEAQAEALEVLRSMFPDIDVPEPTAFQYPRWGNVPWSYGSFSCWPAATTLEQHQNLRANVDRLWFAGEHTSASFFGYMQGAYLEGVDIGNRLAGLVKGECLKDVSEKHGEDGCGEMTRYEVLHGTTEKEEYNHENGWNNLELETDRVAEDKE